MADGIKISALTEATDAQTVDGNLLETAVVDSSSSTGFSSKKTPISRLAQYVLSKFTGLSLGGSARTVKTAIDALQTDVDKKADADGEYDNLIVGTSKQLLSESYTEDFTPYKFRKSPYTDRMSESIVGCSVAWNQLVNTSDTSVTVPSGHKYLSRISGTDAMGASTGTAITVTGTDNVHDLTAMFGSTVADALYNMGDDGVKLFRSWYPNDYYPYTTPTLEHVYGLQSHDMTVGDKTYSYALDASLTLRGLIKYDATKGFYADGDTYNSDGTVDRRYGIVDLGTLNWNYVSGVTGWQSNVLSTALNYTNVNFISDKYICVPWAQRADGCLTCVSSGRLVLTDASQSLPSPTGQLVYPLATPTTETAEPFDAIQITDGTEEYITDCLAPVGHESKYYQNLRSKIEGLPTDFSAIICATEATNKASKNYAVGDYLIYNNTLYKVTTAIAANATLTVGTNITATTIMAEIKALQ